MPHNERRSIFRDCNIHVKNDMVAHTDLLLENNNPDMEQCLSEMVDLLRLRDAHGTCSFVVLFALN